MNNKATFSINYFLAHMLCRDLALSGDFAISFESSPETNRNVFVNLYNKMSELSSTGKLIYSNTPVELLGIKQNLEEQDFASQIVDIKDTQIMVTTFPKPNRSPEVLYVGVVKNSNRYFTLEIYSSMDSYCLCEWDKSNHKNYGECGSTIEDFTKRISEII